MKLFAGLNPWMLPIAAIASFAFGAVWYMSLSKPWMAAAGLTEEKVKEGGTSPAPFIITFLTQLFMAWMLAGLLLHMAKAGLPGNLRNGLITALFVWAGFVMTTLMVNHRFQKQPWSLTLIDGGHWLGVLLIQGGILGLWGLTK
jgi:hypothetical protein